MQPELLTLERFVTRRTGGRFSSEVCVRLPRTIPTPKTNKFHNTYRYQQQRPPGLDQPRLDNSEVDQNEDGTH